ncbi:Glucose 1-dehydrogenase [Eumeta japonica]|uniref:Glucose 1-dehydrogenase n=1 Tax=Eumeta variegata TaxID=151549 RepID=A0A4C1ZC73_EUMVA|nr:Glucose 1-dehydrogenase [Eumeta japonica]
MSFTNKVVIVTGASAGIGAATAKLFAKEGVKLSLVGRNVQKLKETEKECKALSGLEPLSIVADLSNEDEARGVISKAIERFGKLDVLVNNAGVSGLTSILDPSYVAEFDRIQTTNIRAVVVLTHAALPHLIKTKGNIVNVSSIASLTPAATLSPYCTSKTALNQFSRCIALEVGPKGVRVNIVAPGPVNTEIHKSTGMTDEQIAESGNHMPLGFLTESEEIGDMILYLASEKAKSITGSVHVVDVGAALNGMNTTLNYLRGYY